MSQIIFGIQIKTIFLNRKQFQKIVFQLIFKGYAEKFFLTYMPKSTASSQPTNQPPPPY